MEGLFEKLHPGRSFVSLSIQRLMKRGRGVFLQGLALIFLRSSSFFLRQTAAGLVTLVRSLYVVGESNPRWQLPVSDLTLGPATRIGKRMTQFQNVLLICLDSVFSVPNPKTERLYLKVEV